MVVVNEGAFGAVGLAVNAHAAPAPPIAAARGARTRASSYVYPVPWAPPEPEPIQRIDSNST